MRSWRLACRFDEISGFGTRFPALFVINLAVQRWIVIKVLESWPNALSTRLPQTVTPYSRIRGIATATADLWRLSNCNLNNNCEDSSFTRRRGWIQTNALVHPHLTLRSSLTI